MVQLLTLPIYKYHCHRLNQLKIHSLDFYLILWRKWSCISWIRIFDELIVNLNNKPLSCLWSKSADCGNADMFFFLFSHTRSLSIFEIFKFYVVNKFFLQKIFQQINQKFCLIKLIDINNFKFKNHALYKKIESNFNFK